MNSKNYLKKFLIVYAHPEPKSFCGAIKNLTLETLQNKGHQIQLSDLYQMNFNPVISSKDFSLVKNSNHFSFINEQVNSYENNFQNYSNEIQLELHKLKWADNLIFIFPLWWGSFPAIMKGWIDKCLVYGHSWTSKDHYPGLLKGKKSMTVCTGDAIEQDYSHQGVQGMTVDECLHHLNRCSMEFVGIEALKSFVFYKVSSISNEERTRKLEEYKNVLENFENRELLYRNRNFTKF
jgi:NAD(P)H dehydrogenase (quinone)